MLQRVGLCQTLLHDPDVILLDEPMVVLTQWGVQWFVIILEEQSAGRTIFFCSHVLSDVGAFVSESHIGTRSDSKAERYQT